MPDGGLSSARRPSFDQVSLKPGQTLPPPSSSAFETPGMLLYTNPTINSYSQPNPNFNTGLNPMQPLYYKPSYYSYPMDENLHQEHSHDTFPPPQVLPQPIGPPHVMPTNQSTSNAHSMGSILNGQPLGHLLGQSMNAIQPLGQAMNGARHPLNPSHTQIGLILNQSLPPVTSSQSQSHAPPYLYQQYLPILAQNNPPSHHLSHPPSMTSYPHSQPHANLQLSSPQLQAHSQDANQKQAGLKNELQSQLPINHPNMSVGMNPSMNQGMGQNMLNDVNQGINQNGDQGSPGSSQNMNRNTGIASQSMSRSLGGSNQSINQGSTGTDQGVNQGSQALPLSHTVPGSSPGHAGLPHRNGQNIHPTTASPHPNSNVPGIGSMNTVGDSSQNINQEMHQDSHNANNGQAEHSHGPVGPLGPLSLPQNPNFSQGIPHHGMPINTGSYGHLSISQDLPYYRMPIYLEPFYHQKMQNGHQSAIPQHPSHIHPSHHVPQIPQIPTHSQISQFPSQHQGVGRIPAVHFESLDSLKKVAPRSSDLFRVGPPFGPTITHQALYDSQTNTPLRPTIDARIDRGFEPGPGGTWIGYKRNYFTLVASFQLDGIDFDRFVRDSFYTINNTSTGPEKVPISYFALRLVAKCTDLDVQIGLIQHTAKRDKGPQFAPPIFPAVPGTLPDHEIVKASCNKRNGAKIETMNRIFYLDRQQYLASHDLSHLPSLLTYPSDSVASVARFERIQFTLSIRVKVNTLIKRFFSLQVELLGIVATEPQQIQPILLGSVQTTLLVVRGRLPSNYHRDFKGAGPTADGFT